jgi:hypothetical protein
MTSQDGRPRVARHLRYMFGAVESSPGSDLQLRGATELSVSAIPVRCLNRRAARGRDRKSASYVVVYRIECRSIMIRTKSKSLVTKNTGQPPVSTDTPFFKPKMNGCSPFLMLYIYRALHFLPHRKYNTRLSSLTINSRPLANTLCLLFSFPAWISTTKRLDQDHCYF